MATTVDKATTKDSNPPRDSPMTTKADKTNTKVPEVPQGELKDWTQGKSAKGKIFYYRAVDADVSTQKPEVKSELTTKQTFNKTFCNWVPGTNGVPSSDFTKQTSITWYKLDNFVGSTYQLVIKCTESHAFYFNTLDDSYPLAVLQTKTGHSLLYYDQNPNIVSVEAR